MTGKAPEQLPQSAPALPGAQSLFTPETFLPALTETLRDIPDARAIRAKTVEVLAQARAAAISDIAAGFMSHPRAARETVRAIATLTDATVTAIHHVATTILHPRTNPTDAERLAVLAIGGYGRAEMAPQSDVDLLFLTPWKVTGWAESVVESMLYMLWDLKLKVGQATRSIDDCLRLMDQHGIYHLLVIDEHAEPRRRYRGMLSVSDLLRGFASDEKSRADLLEAFVFERTATA